MYGDARVLEAVGNALKLHNDYLVTQPGESEFMGFARQILIYCRMLAGSTFEIIGVEYILDQAIAGKFI